MVVYAGPWWINGVQEDGWIETDGQRVLQEGDGAAEGTAERAVILDGLVNFHTHIGDAFLQGQELPKDLEALVAPGSGLKHRRLAAARPRQVEEGIRDVLERFAQSGIIEVLDFREQGPAGVELARSVAAERSDLRVRFFGRPAEVPWTGREPERLVAVADGLGVPSLSDYGLQAVDELRLAFWAAHKPFGLHVSEGEREPMDEVLALQPDFLVHACQASEADLDQVARAHVPMVFCPTSNAFFGLRPPVEGAEERGIPWYLGTDNAMLGSTDLLSEVRQLRSSYPHVSDESILRALTTRPQKAIKRIGRLESGERPPRRVVILPWAESGEVRWDGASLVLER